MDFDREFESKGIENLDIMEKVGFLKQQGYGKNSGWKIIVLILGVLTILGVFFVGYGIWSGKFEINANPNVLCESQDCSCNCPEQVCNCGNTTCLSPIVNITINNLT